MPGRCNCPGQACGCSIQAGTGVVVEGTGTANNPFLLSLDARAIEIDQSATGALDLSAYAGDPIITVNLLQNATSVILPSAPGTRMELVIVQAAAGKTVAWPFAIRWTGGSAPAQGTTVGEGTWVVLRQAAGFWVGTSYGVV